VVHHAFGPAAWIARSSNPTQIRLFPGKAFQPFEPLFEVVAFGLLREPGPDVLGIGRPESVGVMNASRRMLDVFIPDPVDRGEVHLSAQPSVEFAEEPALILLG
jgi:hypothetical protein